MMIYPPYLKLGNTIGIVCPSGYMPIQRVQKAIEIIKQWGFEVKLGKTAGHQHHYFSGTDAERLQDVQSMLDDPSIDAILCGRGGYGLSKIIDAIDFSSFIKNSKWIVGFSDITLLQAHLYTQYHISTIHGAMAGAFEDYGVESATIQSLYNVLMGKKMHYTSSPHPFNKNGIATGNLVGGNLTMLAHSIGTASDIEYNNCILCIEDVGEYIYNIDRMMVQLKRSGKLKRLQGLIVGGFTDMKDTTIPFGCSVYEAIQHIISDFDFPVCFDFPISHSEQNVAFKYGALCTLEVNSSKVFLKEL